MSQLGIFKQELKNLLSYLKSAPSNLSKCKVYFKFVIEIKTPKFVKGGIFRQESKTTIVMFEISTLEFA